MPKFFIFILPFFLWGCTSTRPAPPPIESAYNQPWGALDLDINSTSKSTIRESLGGALAQKAKRYQNKEGNVPYNVLALSGGGSRGSFGAGIISGWNERGDMPVFDVITGISTGSIMAPFIFLGSDDELKKMNDFYTKKTTEEVFTNSWHSIFTGAHIMNAEPLKALFIKTFDKAFLQKVAEQHKAGRRLYIGTTNIDTGQLTVWDMGAIAASERPEKYQRFSDIIYASVAMPIYLPPQYMPVDIDGKTFYQMHVDGGIHSQIFMIGLLPNWQEKLNLDINANTNFDKTLYTIANRKYRQRDNYIPVEQNIGSVIKAYVLTEMDLLFDRSMYRLYSSCKENDIHFKMIAIPEKMPDIIDDSLEFDPEKTAKLFNFAHEIGKAGVKWQESISINEYDAHK